MKDYWLVMAATKSIADGGAISDDLKGAIITACVTGIISIVGFIATNISMNKNFKNEIRKQRNSLALDKMSTIPYEVLLVMDELIAVGNNKAGERKMKESLDHFKRIMHTIYCYGSENAIKIVSLMQKENYAASKSQEDMNKYRLFAAYVLLATQIKYDVTEVSVSPELWFQMRMNDYEKSKLNFQVETNNLVDELGLSGEFKIV